MRLDKFLKASRIIKRRTLAKEVCDSDRVTVNGRPAKAGTTVSVNDHIVIAFSRKKIEVEVLMLKENSRVEEAREMYRTISEIPVQDNFTDI